MSTLALSGTARRWVSRLHRWSGLTLLLFLFVTGVTGAVLSFRWELDRALNPHLFRVAPQATPKPYAELLQKVERSLPESVVSAVIVPKAPEDAVILFVKSHMEAHVAHVHVPGMKSSVDFNQIFVNPYTGDILGRRSTTRFIATVENLVPDLVRFHYTLFLDEAGAWLLGVSALIWLLTSLIGISLAWPAGWKSGGNWRPLFSVRSGSGRYLFNYDLHRITALITLPVLLVVAFSSIYMNLPGMVKPVVAAFSPLTGTATAPMLGSIDPAARRITPEEAIAAARTAMPGARVHSFGHDYLKGLYSVRMQLPEDVSPAGNNVVFVGMTDAKVAFVRRHADATGGDVFLAWQRPLHTGNAFGLAGQLLILAGALALIAMCVTGFNVWVRKTRRSVSGGVAAAAHAVAQDS